MSNLTSKSYSEEIAYMYKNSQLGVNKVLLNSNLDIVIKCTKNEVDRSNIHTK